MERTQEVEGIPSHDKQWDKISWWLCEWDVMEVFPFIAACVGFGLGVLIASFCVGYAKGASWVRK